MMNKFTYRTLIWVIVVLLATNLSMGISFLYHKQQDKKMMEQLEKDPIKVPSERRTRFFRDQLNLNGDQVDEFRELNRDYNRIGWEITHQLEELRIEMVEELGKKESDREALKIISEEIGKLHKDLKNQTIDYYLGMKDVCDKKQREKLNDIFISMLKKNENVSLPGNGRRRGNRFR